MYFKAAKANGLMPAVIILLTLTAAGSLHAENPPFEYNIFIFQGKLSADFNFERMFTDELVESIKTGLPIHLELSVKLKNERLALATTFILETKLILI